MSWARVRQRRETERRLSQKPRPSPATDPRRSLSEAEYVHAYSVAMWQRGRPLGVVEDRMVPLVDQAGRLSCLFPGGYALASLWDVTQWYKGSPYPVPAPWAIRLFDYDDGQLELYGEREPLYELWGLLCAAGALHEETDINPFGFKPG